jgi:hypothetical protein
VLWVQFLAVLIQQWLLEEVKKDVQDVPLELTQELQGQDLAQQSKKEYPKTQEAMDEMKGRKMIALVRAQAR